MSIMLLSATAAAGFIIGYASNVIRAKVKAKKQMRMLDSIVPSLDYDPTNPINQSRFSDPIEVNGVKLWRIC